MTAPPSSVLDAVAVGSHLPHRYPFLALDRVEELQPGKSGRGIKLVSGGELLGPGQALPSLMLLEAGAQLLGLVAGVATGDSPEKPAVGYLAAIETFLCHRAVKAGDRVVVEVVLGRRLGSLLQGEFQAFVGGELVAEGRLTAMNGEPPYRRS